MAEMETILASLLIFVMAFLLIGTVISAVLLLAYGLLFKKEICRFVGTSQRLSQFLTFKPTLPCLIFKLYQDRSHATLKIFW